MLPRLTPVPTEPVAQVIDKLTLMLVALVVAPDALT
jgi:hypothetical protein